MPPKRRRRGPIESRRDHWTRCRGWAMLDAGHGRKCRISVDTERVRDALTGNVYAIAVDRFSQLETGATDARKAYLTQELRDLWQSSARPSVRLSSTRLTEMSLTLILRTTRRRGMSGAKRPKLSSSTQGSARATLGTTLGTPPHIRSWPRLNC